MRTFFVVLFLYLGIIGSLSYAAEHTTIDPGGSRPYADPTPYEPKTESRPHFIDKQSIKASVTLTAPANDCSKDNCGKKPEDTNGK